MLSGGSHKLLIACNAEHVAQGKSQETCHRPVQSLYNEALSQHVEQDPVNFTSGMFIYLFKKMFFIVLQVQFSAFSPNPNPPHLPSLFPPPFVIVHVSFIIVPVNPFPYNPLPSPL